MAVNIDTVYQKVLAVANKEQRGYITPQEFNLFANQAQMDIFEQYFYDINQFGRVPGNDTEYSDMLGILNEKINIFETTGTCTRELVGYLQDPIFTLPPLYRLGTVRYSSLTGAGADIGPDKDFDNAVGSEYITASDDVGTTNQAANLDLALSLGSTLPSSGNSDPSLVFQPSVYRTYKVSFDVPVLSQGNFAIFLLAEHHDDINPSDAANKRYYGRTAKIDKTGHFEFVIRPTAVVARNQVFQQVWLNTGEQNLNPPFNIITAVPGQWIANQAVGGWTSFERMLIIKHMSGGTDFVGKIENISVKEVGVISAQVDIGSTTGTTVQLTVANSNIVAGAEVIGAGIKEGTTVASISGMSSAPFTITLSETPDTALTDAQVIEFSGNWAIVDDKVRSSNAWMIGDNANFTNNIWYHNATDTTNQYQTAWAIDDAGLQLEAGYLQSKMTLTEDINYAVNYTIKGASSGKLYLANHLKENIPTNTIDDGTSNNLLLWDSAVNGNGSFTRYFQQGATNTGKLSIWHDQYFNGGLAEVTVTTTTETTGVDAVEVERVLESDITNIIRSNLTTPTTTRPVYVRRGNDLSVYPTSIASGVTCNFIRKPIDPKWNYTEINGTALYNSGTSQDFELHASEEVNLVIKILKIAGVAVKEPNLTQAASQEEIMNIQQEKQ